MDVFDVIIAVMALFMLSYLCARMNRSEISLNIFLASMATGICILIWIPILPSYFIVFSALIIIGMVISGRGESE